MGVTWLPVRLKGGSDLPSGCGWWAGTDSAGSRCVNLGATSCMALSRLRVAVTFLDAPAGRGLPAPLPDPTCSAVGGGT